MRREGKGEMEEQLSEGVKKECTAEQLGKRERNALSLTPSGVCSRPSSRSKTFPSNSPSLIFSGTCSI